MEDKFSLLMRAMTSDGSARLILADSTEIVRSASRYHCLSKTMTATLGRALTVTSMMGCLLKDKDNSVTLKIKGDGPAGAVTCTADYIGNVRGYAEHPDAELPPNANGKLDVGGSVGRGDIYVIKDMNMGEPYIGVCPIISGEIAEDMTEYFASSEQTPSVCALGVRVNKELYCTAAGGFLLQLMPGADEGVAELLEKNVTSLPSISEMLSSGMKLEDICGAVLSGVKYDIFDTIDVRYQCGCSKERYSKALISLGRDELTDMINEGKDVVTKCHFCGSEYVFTSDDIKELLMDVNNKDQNQ